MATRNSQQNAAPGSNIQRNPDEWKTKDEPMTPAQASYLRTLSEETGERFDPNMTKAEAAKKIDELRQRDPRLQQSGKTSR
ncbi:MAG: DUF3072 domain-containing protein [Rhodomicrobium sp.]